MHSHGNTSIWISEHFIQSFMLILKNILRILTEMQNFVRMLVSLKRRNCYLKLIFYRSCFECIEIIRIWFFWCIVTWLSLTLSCKKNLLSMLRWFQTTTDHILKCNYFYVWQKSLPYPLKIKFSPVPSALPTWNFVWCYSRALVNVRDIIGKNTTSKSREMSFDI